MPKAEAQRLLDGASGDSAVADLLRAAAGPARPGELAGERDAVAAFRQEHAGGAPGRRGKQAGSAQPATPDQPVTPPRRARRARRRVAVLVTALTVGALAGAGVAAGAGRLPAPLQSAAHDWIDRVPDHEPEPGRSAPSPQRTVRAGSPTAPPGSQRPSGTAGPTPSPGGPAVPSVPGSGVPGGPGGPGATAGPDMKKLCGEWQKVRDDPHRKPMDAEDLRVLTAAAGGPDRIEAYCGLGPAPSGTKSKKAGPP